MPACPYAQSCLFKLLILMNTELLYTVFYAHLGQSNAQYGIHKYQNDTEIRLAS